MPSKFNPMKARFRATFAAGSVAEPRVEKIDRENEILYGVQVTLEGEAKGHGVFLDRAFCESVVEAGNAMGDAGVKCRFGHPAMCSDALGTYLGRMKNFRLADVTRKESGEKVAGVLADLYIAPESHSAPSGDLGKWVMEAAENSPDQFGQSIVFTYGDLKSTDANGNPILRSEFETDGAFDVARGENKVFAVLGKLHGSDFTDTPAATDGVFSQDSLAAEAEDMLAEHPEIADALTAHPEKVIEFLDRMGLLSVIETKRVAGLQAAKDKTIAELRAEFEDYKRRSVDALAAAESQTKEQLDAKDAEIAALAEVAEKNRSELDAAAADLAAVRAENESLTTDVTTKTKALEQAAADIQQLEGKVAKAETALAEAQAALEVEIQRYREVVGSAMSQPDAGLPESAKSWTAKYRAVRRNH